MYRNRREAKVVTGGIGKLEFERQMLAIEAQDGLN